MLSEKLKKEQSFAFNFFESALSNNESKFSHAYMLTGSDTIAQYHLVMQIAEELNCQNRKAGEIYTENCTCTSCSWINQNRHPAVITISPVDYTYANKDSKSTSVISVHQARYLKNALGNSSPYHRVIIFTDAAEGKEYEKQALNVWKNYNDILCSPPLENSSDRINWIPLPLTRKTFQSETANTLLKILEEPSPEITFFFLTRDKEDMLDTIVSRCQTIPVLSRHETDNTNQFEELCNLFPPQNLASAINLSEKIIQTSKQESCSIDEILDNLQKYLLESIKSDHTSKIQVISVSELIKNIEEAKKELENYVNPQAVLDSLLMRISQSN